MAVGRPRGLLWSTACERFDAARRREIREPKTEIRRKLEIRNPNSEPLQHAARPSPAASFGLRISDFLRISVFGFRIWPALGWLWWRFVVALGWLCPAVQGSRFEVQGSEFSPFHKHTEYNPHFPPPSGWSGGTLDIPWYHPMPIDPPQTPIFDQASLSKSLSCGFAAVPRCSGLIVGVGTTRAPGRAAFRRESSASEAAIEIAAKRRERGGRGGEGERDGGGGGGGVGGGRGGGREGGGGGGGRGRRGRGGEMGEGGGGGGVGGVGGGGRGGE